MGWFVKRQREPATAEWCGHFVNTAVVNSSTVWPEKVCLRCARKVAAAVKAWDQRQ